MESNIDTTCPACGGVNVSTVTYGHGAGGGCTRLDHSPNRQCHDCRHHWLDIDDPGYKEYQTTILLVSSGSYLPANTWHWISWTTRPPTYLWGTKVREKDLSESPGSDAPITDLCGQNLEKVWKWTNWDGDGSPSETSTHHGSLQFAGSTLEIGPGEFHLTTEGRRRALNVDNFKHSDLDDLVGETVSATECTESAFIVRFGSSACLEFPHRTGDPKPDSGGIVVDWVDD